VIRMECPWWFPMMPPVLRKRRCTSRKVYKTPWPGDPRVNIQRGKDGNAKACQVRQVLDAIARLEAERNQESDDGA
jgi:hypothetical protein